MQLLVVQGGSDFKNVNISVGNQINMDNSYRERPEILNWLSPLSFEQKQRDEFAKRHENTGQWFLEDKRYQKWLTGEEITTMWCPGYPGAGKTVLTSMIVDKLLHLPPEDTAVSYVYCDYRDQEKHSPENLIASLACQLAQQYHIRFSELPEEVKYLYTSHGNGKKSLELKDCVSLILSIVKNLGKTFVVIDALDECADCSNPRRQDGSYIEEKFKDAVQVEIRANVGDIKQYLQNYMKASIRYGALIFSDPKVNEDILCSISKNCDGIFLLAKLHIEYLSWQPSVRDIVDALPELPNSLEKMYGDEISRIRAQQVYGELAVQVLMWIYLAKRPLSIEELRHALSVRVGDAAINASGFYDPILLTGICNCLVYLDSKSNVVRLIHNTLNEYLKKNWQDLSPKAECKIATACVTYLSFDIFSEGCCPNDEAMENRIHDYPFLEYAARYWGDHVRDGPREKVKELALKFLEHGQKLNCCNQATHLSKRRYSGYSQVFPKDVTGLQTAALFGLGEIAQLLIDRDSNVKAKDSRKRTALHNAAKGGHEAVVALLVKNGAEVDAIDCNKQTALHEAAKGGHGGIAQLLIVNEANSNVKDNDWWTPLHFAADGGHEVVGQILIGSGAEVEAEDKYQRRALHEAAKNGNKALIELLIMKGADINAKDKYGQTALYLATEGGHKAAVELLLEHHSEVNEQDNSGRTALHQASNSGDSAIAQLLVDNEADVNERDYFGQTALHLAAENGSDAIVQLLIEKEANINSCDEERHTPLYLAAAEGHKTTTELLCRKGANIVADDTEG